MRLRVFAICVLLGYTSMSGAIETMIVPASSRLLRGITAAGDVVMVLMAISAMLRNRSYYGVWLWVLMVSGALLTYAYNLERYGLVAQANGLRSPLFFLSCLIVMQDLFESEYRELVKRWFKRLLLIFAVVQIPVSLGQFVLYGAGDNVGGTFGTEGGSGVLTLIVFLVTFYLLVEYGSLEGGTNFSLKKAILLSLLLTPCVINETKISFVLVGMMVILVSLSRTKWYKAIPFLALGGVLFSLFFYYYGQTVGDPSQIFTQKFIEDYLYSAPKSQQAGDLPRLLRVSLMFQMFRSDLPAIFLGMGYGVFGGGTVLEVSRLARSLYYLTTGSRILLVTIWLQGGLIALIAMMGGTFGYLRTTADLPMTVRRLGLFLAATLALVWIYNEALLERMVAMVVAYLMVWIRHAGLEEEEQEATETTVDDSTDSSREPDA